MMDSISILLEIQKRLFVNRLKRKYLFPEDDIEKEEFLRDMLEYGRMVDWLSKKFGITKEAVRYHLKKLKKMGYLKSERSSLNEKISFYGLTRLGKRMAIFEMINRFSIEDFSRSILDNFHNIIDKDDIPSTIQLCHSLSRYGFRSFIREKILEVLDFSEEDIIEEIIKEKNLREGMLPEELMAWMVSFKLLLGARRMYKIDPSFLKVAKNASKILYNLFKKHRRIFENPFIPWIPARILINYSLSEVKNRQIISVIKSFLESLVRRRKLIPSLDIYRVPASETTSVILESLLTSGEFNEDIFFLFRKVFRKKEWRFDPHKISHVLRVGYLLKGHLNELEKRRILYYTGVLLLYSKYLWMKSTRKDLIIDVKSHPKAEVASTILEYWEDIQKIAGGVKW